MIPYLPIDKPTCRSTESNSIDRPTYLVYLILLINLPVAFSHIDQLTYYMLYCIQSYWSIYLYVVSNAIGYTEIYLYPILLNNLPVVSNPIDQLTCLFYTISNPIDQFIYILYLIILINLPYMCIYCIWSYWPTYLFYLLNPNLLILLLAYQFDLIILITYLSICSIKSY